MIYFFFIAKIQNFINDTNIISEWVKFKHNCQIHTHKTDLKIKAVFSSNMVLHIGQIENAKKTGYLATLNKGITGVYVIPPVFRFIRKHHNIDH